MPSRTVYIDIDLTLVDLGGELLPYAAQRIKEMYDTKGYKLIAWSAGGHEYARRIITKHDLLSYFQYILDKPDWIIDDYPEGILEHAKVLTVHNKGFWEKFWETLFKKEVY